MTSMIIGGDVFRVEIDGDSTRPALVLSNSLGTDLGIWDQQMPAFLEHFRVVRYDSRGHGGSVTAPGPYSIEDLGRDVIRILDALEIDRAHFAGISMGGAVGQWLLVHAPHRLERVVLACTAGRLGTPDSWNARIVIVRRDGMDATAAATLERWFSAAFAAREPAKIGPVREMLLRTSPEGYASCCAALRDMDLREDIRGLDTPVLVVTGSGDPVISSEDTRCLLERLRDSTHVTVDAKHIANIEAATAFTEAVVRFLTAKRPANRRKTAADRAQSPNQRGKAVVRATAARRPLAKGSSGPRRPRVARSARKVDASKARKAVGARRPKRAETLPRPSPAKPVAKKTRTPTRKKAPKKTAGVTTRRPTKAVAVRAAVKKTAAKQKTGKASTKKVTKQAAKRPPASRRTSSKAPRRPSGRRKT